MKNEHTRRLVSNLQKIERVSIEFELAIEIRSGLQIIVDVLSGILTA
jgi:hypothetical protein